MRIMASLIRSAAVPCSGVFTAVRSAKLRAFGFGCCISGMGRLRPNMFTATPLRRTSAMVASMNRRTPA